MTTVTGGNVTWWKPKPQSIEIVSMFSSKLQVNGNQWWIQFCPAGSLKKCNRLRNLWIVEYRNSVSCCKPRPCTLFRAKLSMLKCIFSVCTIFLFFSLSPFLFFFGSKLYSVAQNISVAIEKFVFIEFYILIYGIIWQSGECRMK